MITFRVILRDVLVAIVAIGAVVGAIYGVILIARSARAEDPCVGRACPPDFRAFSMHVNQTTSACVCILEAKPVRP